MGWSWPWDCGLGLDIGLDSVWPWPWSVGLGLECSAAAAEALNKWNGGRALTGEGGLSPSHLWGSEYIRLLPRKFFSKI